MTLALDGSAINTTVSGTTVVVTLTTAGPGLVFITTASNAAVSGIAASGLTFNQVSGLPYNNSTSNFVDIWWSVSAGALSSRSITVTMSSTTFVTAIAFGVSGANTSSPFDGAVVTNSGTNVQISTTAAATFIFATEVDNNTSVGSGFTQIENSTNFNFTDYKVVASPQTNLVCGTQNASASKQWAAVAIVAASGGSAFTISPAAGSYSISGNGPTLNASRSIKPVAGSYAISGNAATSIRGKGLQAALGTYSISGKPATFNVGISIDPPVGSYSIGGQTPHAVVTIGLAAGSYSIGGVTQGFAVALSVKPAVGTYAIGGVAPVLTYTKFGSDNVVHGNPFFATPGRMTSIP